MRSGLGMQERGRAAGGWGSVKVAGMARDGSAIWLVASIHAGGRRDKKQGVVFPGVRRPHGHGFP